MAEYAAFAPVVLKLLKGPLYYDDSSWTELLIHQRKVAGYLKDIGLELVLSEADGYAFLSQPSEEEGEEVVLPRLIPRRGLSFEVSLLSIVLREELERFDPEKSESNKVFITQSQVRNKIRAFFPEVSDEIRLFRELDRHITALEKLRYIRRAGGGRENEDPLYEILPILKARVTPEFVTEFKDKLEEYGNTIS